MMSHKRFVFESIDPSTECVVHEALLEVEDWKELCSQLQLELADFDPRARYELNVSNIDRVKRHFKIAFETGESHVSIRPWRATDALPYKIHTNRELALMLIGSKPLAAFIGVYPPRADCEDIPERLFEPYVIAGGFIKRERICPDATLEAAGRVQRFRRVLYTQPNQEWRIDSYLLLHQTAKSSGWSEEMERMEGTLLGYEDWQNDAYIEMIYKVA